MRCLLSNLVDIPLNQGCLAPITINIPKGSFLNPTQNAAVVGGNVLTSQRVTDVVLLAFKACAASQGCMNNLTFGDTTMGYYGKYIRIDCNILTVSICRIRRDDCGRFRSWSNMAWCIRNTYSHD